MNGVSLFVTWIKGLCNFNGVSEPSLNKSARNAGLKLLNLPDVSARTINMRTREVVHSIYSLP
jgi:hypothetical protein